jgi:hypothetical protein
MPKLTMTVPHALGQQEALERLQERFHAAIQSYGDRVQGLEQQWNDNALTYRFQAFGVSVNGSARVEPSEVTVVMEMPLMASMFKGTIEKQLREELGRILA